MNVFEGARRISALVIGLTLFAGIWAAVEKDPNVEIQYLIRGLNTPPVRSDEECLPWVDGSVTKTYQTPKGRNFNIDLCFKASGSGEKQIPYRDAGNSYTYVGNRWSPEVEAYMKEYAETRFAPTQQDAIDADDKYWRFIFQERLKVFGWFVLASFVFWATTWVVGWIARGFAGIPMGHDRKPQQ